MAFATSQPAWSLHCAGRRASRRGVGRTIWSTRWWTGLTYQPESKASAGLPSVDPSDSDSKVAKRTGASSAKGESRLAPDEVNDALRVEELAASSSGRTTSAPLERDGSVAIMSPEITTMLATQADAMAELRSASRALSETFDPSNLNLNDLFADRNVVGRELAAQSNAMADVARIIEETQRSLTEGMESVSGTARSLGDAQAETNRLIGESNERAVGRSTGFRRSDSGRDCRDDQISEPTRTKRAVTF